MLRVQYYDDSAGRESPPNGRRRLGADMGFSGLKWGLSCGMQTDRSIFQSAFMQAETDGMGGLQVYVIHIYIRSSLIRAN